MNIVFLLRYWPIYGGGETVTRILANKFVELGYTVSIVYLWDKRQGNMPYINKKIREERIAGVSPPHGEDGIPTPDFRLIERYLHKYIMDNSIDIIINQWFPAKTVQKARNNTKAKLVCCHHTNIFMPPETAKHRIFLSLFKQKGAVLLARKRWGDKYRFSDKLVVLCDSFVDDCKKVFDTNNEDGKIVAILNPLPDENVVSKPEIAKKEKELLFVGRIIKPVKRISYIINTWKSLQSMSEYHEWRLTIVGDGADLDYLKQYAADLDCRNIFFEGYQNPLPYYKRASILLLTSSFEGFSMVLVEAQQNGCVPVVMDSYATLHEIVHHDSNGLIVKNYDLSGYISAVASLMADENHRMRLAYKGLETCKKFSVDTVIKKWEALFGEWV